MIGLAEGQAAVWDGAQPPPFRCLRPENLCQDFSCPDIAFCPDAPAILDRHLFFIFQDLREDDRNPFQDVHRLESRNDGSPARLRNEAVGFGADDGTDVSRAQETINPQGRILDEDLHGRRDDLVNGENGQVMNFLLQAGLDNGGDSR